MRINIVSGTDRPILKQVLEYATPSAAGAVDPQTLPGVVIDDEDAPKVGFTAFSSSLAPFVGAGYCTTGTIAAGNKARNVGVTRDLRVREGQGGRVTVTNAGADGYVVIDAIQWLPVEK